MDAVVHPDLQHHRGAAHGRRRAHQEQDGLHLPLRRRGGVVHGHGRTARRHRAVAGAQPHARDRRRFLRGARQPRGRVMRPALHRLAVRQAQREVRR